MAKAGSERLVPEARDALARFKQDIANELGISKKLADLGPTGVSYAEYGRLGGQMVKRLVLMAKGELHAEGQKGSDGRKK